MKRLMTFLVAAMLIAPAARAQTTIVADVRAAIAKKDLKGADALLATFPAEVEPDASSSG